MSANPEFGWAIPVVLIILALLTLRDREFRHSLKEFMDRSNKPFNLAQMDRRTKSILVGGGLLLAAAILVVAGILIGKGGSSGDDLVAEATNTPRTTLAAGNYGTQTSVSSGPGITVTETAISSGPAITVPEETPTPFTLSTMDMRGTQQVPWTVIGTATP